MCFVQPIIYAKGIVYRRDFAGKPVRIAELQRWLYAEAGENGWLKPEKSGTGPKVAVIGGGLSTLSCSYYLSLAGCQATVFAEEEHPGVFVGAEFLANGISVVEAAAIGRKAAMNIWHYLTNQR